MTEPVYLAQNGEPLSDAEIRQWMHDRATEAMTTHGCQYVRFSVHPDIPMRLVEGWDKTPDNWVFGEPRWQLVAIKENDNGQ